MSCVSGVYGRKYLRPVNKMAAKAVYGESDEYVKTWGCKWKSNKGQRIWTGRKEEVPFKIVRIWKAGERKRRAA